VASDPKTIIVRGVSEQELRHSRFTSYERINDEKGFGACIARRTLGRMLESFGLSIMERGPSEHYAGMEEILAIKGSPATPESKVYLDNGIAFPSEGGTACRNALEDLSRHIGKPILVSRNSETYSGTLVVRILNITQGVSEGSVHATRFEGNLTYIWTKETWLPTIEKDGVTLADISKSIVTLRFDALRNDSTFVLPIVCELLKDTYNDLSESERDTYANAYSSIRSEKIRETQDKLDSELKSLEEHRKKVIDSVREIEGLQMLIGQASNISRNKMAAKRDFDAIGRRSYVKKVDLINPIMSFELEKVACTEASSQAKYDIGSFRVKINTRESSVRFERTEEPALLHINKHSSHSNWGIHNMLAPHIFSSGQGCFGDAENSLASLIGKMDIPSALDLMYSFLQTANSDDEAGARVYEWPLVGENEDHYLTRLDVMDDLVGKNDRPFRPVEELESLINERIEAVRKEREEREKFEKEQEDRRAQQQIIRAQEDETANSETIEEIIEAPDDDVLPF